MLDPTRYDVSLEPDLETNTFCGVVVITGTVRAPTSLLLLHGQALEVTSASLSVGDQVFTCRANVDPEARTISFHFEHDIPVSREARLTVSFLGSVGAHAGQARLRGPPTALGVT